MVSQPIRSRRGTAFGGLLAALAVIAILFRGMPLTLIYLGFTVVGWAIGLPFVLAVPERWVRRASWTVIVVAGALLGALSLALIFVGVALVESPPLLLSPDRLFTGTGFIRLIAVLASIAGVVVYAGLLRRRSGDLD